MKKQRRWLTILIWGICFNLLLLCLWTPESLATTIQQIPYPPVESGVWISDVSNSLTSETKAQINREISDLNAKNSSTILVAIVPKVEPSIDKNNWFPSISTEQFARNLFREWHLKATYARRILVLVSTGDRHIEILANRAAAVRLPSSSLQHIIQRQFIPSIKSSNLDQGILATTLALIQAIQYAPSPKQVRQGNVWLVVLLAFVMTAPVIGFAVAGSEPQDEGDALSIGLGGDSSGGDSSAGGDW